MSDPALGTDAPGPDARHGVGPTVVLGVTGGIAAYKAVEVCRQLMDAGVRVLPVLTEDATRFVGALTFSVLASEPAKTALWDPDDPIPHTRLGQRADLVLVAPATARFLGSYAHGISDSLLLATVLATRAPVMVCPAMHTEMWEHPAVEENMAILARRGVHIVAPGVGRLAGGDVGAGRLAEPVAIVAAALELLATVATGADTTPRWRRRDLEGCRVVVTAGGTREPIDPVRFISNRSSGKQGHALADAAVARGARVVLITTTELATPVSALVVRVDTAAAMEAAVVAHGADADVVVMAAAVADFRPKVVAQDKLHKADGVPDVILEPTTDILAELGRARHRGQILVGFAAETGDVAPRALAKLQSKGLDIIVANDVGAEGVGFDYDTNAVTIFGSDGTRRDVPLSSKRRVADEVFDTVVGRLGGLGAEVPHRDAQSRRST